MLNRCGMDAKSPKRYTVVFQANRQVVRSTHEILAADDCEAIRIARLHLSMNVGCGFCVKQGERTIHTEQPLSDKRDTAAFAKTQDRRRKANYDLGKAHVAYLDLAAEVEGRRERGQRISAVYRIYLRDGHGNVLSGHTVAVESNDEAIKIAAILCNACAETAASFEVWKGEMLLTPSRAERTVAAAAEVSQRTQQIVIDTEIALRDSKRALAESRRLLDAIDEWQKNAAEHGQSRSVHRRAR